jgi:hypothetical protein
LGTSGRRSSSVQAIEGKLSPEEQEKISKVAGKATKAADRAKKAEKGEPKRVPSPSQRKRVSFTLDAKTIAREER